MPWFKVRRRVSEDLPVIQAKNEREAEGIAIMRSDDPEWEIYDCDYYVEEVDPVEYGVMSMEEALREELSNARALIRKLSPYARDLSDDLREEVNEITKVKV